MQMCTYLDTAKVAIDLEFRLGILLQLRLDAVVRRVPLVRVAEVLFASEESFRRMTAFHRLEIAVRAVPPVVFVIFPELLELLSVHLFVPQLDRRIFDGGDLVCILGLFNCEVCCLYNGLPDAGDGSTLRASRSHARNCSAESRGIVSLDGSESAAERPCACRTVRECRA